MCSRLRPSSSSSGIHLPKGEAVRLRLDGYLEAERALKVLESQHPLCGIVPARYAHTAQ
jgi:hypothetical protein